MADIQIFCPHCDHRFSVSADLAETYLKCPHCGENFKVIPPPTPAMEQSTKRPAAVIALIAIILLPVIMIMSMFSRREHEEKELLKQERKTDWQNFALAQTSRKREAVEWSIYYHFNTGDTVNPRLFIIGDSICYGYYGAVRNELASDANISFWAVSKCVTDPEYLRELDFMLGSYHYDFISFNNGLHSISSAPEEYQEAYRNVIRFIRAKCPSAQIVITTSTPCFSEEKTAKVRTLNEVAWAVASEMDLEVLDLFAHLDPLDREANWRDEYHYQPDAIDLQGKVIADFFRPRLNSSHNVKQQGTATGPDGAID